MADAKFSAATDLIGRTGASALEFRESTEGTPTVFVAIATYPPGRPGLDPQTRERGVLTRPCYAVAAGLTPQRALEALLEEVVDGGECRHCRKPSAFTSRFDDPLADATNAHLCWFHRGGGRLVVGAGRRVVCGVDAMTKPGRVCVFTDWGDWAVPLRFQVVWPVTIERAGVALRWPWQVEVQVGPFRVWAVGVMA